MTNIGYTHSPAPKIGLTGDVSGNLNVGTLTVAIDGQFVTLDDTVTQRRLHPANTFSADKDRFRSAKMLKEYFDFLIEGGVLAAPSDVCDILYDKGTNVVKLSSTAGTYDIGSLTAEIDNNGLLSYRSFKIKQGNTVLVKGLRDFGASFDGLNPRLKVVDLIDHLNKFFVWDSPSVLNQDGTVESIAQDAQDRFGYAFTGGFAGKPVDNNYAWEAGAGINLTAGEFTHMQFDPSIQEVVDSPYWGSPAPTGNGAHIDADIFEGIHLPDGVSRLFDYDYVWDDGGVGRIDVSDAQPGDLLRVRMDYNVIPSISNSVIEAALDFSTRDVSDNVTFQFYLTANPSTFGNTSAGQSYLLRTEMTAYFASNEDVNALVRPVVRCNNICTVQPLSILAILQK